MSPERQAPLTSGEAKSLSILDVFGENHDALIHVLARTCAADHAHLRQTCKTFCTLLNSSRFRSERAVEELAETKAVLWTRKQSLEYVYRDENGSDCDDDDESLDDKHDMLRPFGTYYEGATKFHADISVDGVKQQGEIVGYIIDRPTGGYFYDICDAISSELAHHGCSICDENGAIKTKEIKQVVDAIPDDSCFVNKYEDGHVYRLMAEAEEKKITTILHNRVSFIYIEEFHLNQPEHCLNGKIAADALISLFYEPPLAHQWSLITYVPSSSDFETREIRELDPHNDPSNRALLFGEPKTKEYVEKEKAHDLALDDCAKKDMRRFLRAGFRQFKELRDESDYYHVYTIPSFFNENTAMISEAQVMAMSIVEKPVYIDEPSGKDAELYHLFVRQCRALEEMRDDARHKYQREMQLWEQLVAEKEDDLLEIFERDFEGSPDETRLSARNELEQTMARIQSNLETERRSAFEGEAFQAWKLKLENDARMLVQDGASIERSTCLHCIANHGYIDVMKKLLDLLPDGESRHQVVNSFDPKGCTPLMSAAGSWQINVTMKYEMCHALIQLGAVPTLRNKFNKTAWTTYRAAKQNSIDFGFLFSRAQRREAKRQRSRLEALLRAPDGEGEESDETVESSSVSVESLDINEEGQEGEVGEASDESDEDA